MPRWNRPVEANNPARSAARRIVLPAGRAHSGGAGSDGFEFCSRNRRLFLATVDGGRTMSNYGKNQTIFSQGDVADSVFYIREGKVKVTVHSDRGKEAFANDVQRLFVGRQRKAG
jgi:CRP-like cAMP-binding protein